LTGIVSIEVKNAKGKDKKGLKETFIKMDMKYSPQRVEKVLSELLDFE